VALESALITHGFAPPANLDIARQMQAAVREEGALAATVAVLEGEARVGLTGDELARLASDRAARKVSLRDLPAVLAQGASGGTTVAATMHLAHRAAAGSLGQHGGQVAQADLAGCPVGGQPRQFVPGQPHPRLTLEHGDGGR